MMMTRQVTVLFLLLLLAGSCRSKEGAAENLPPEPVVDSLTFLFAGDAMQHLPQVNAARTGDGGYDYRSCFARIAEVVTPADVAVVNLETTLGGRPYTGYPQFSSPEEYAAALKQCGFDILLTANNHCLDRYRRGALRTLDRLDSLGIIHTGTYRDEGERERLCPLMLRVHGIAFAVLDYTYGTNGIEAEPPLVVDCIDTTMMKRDIAEARRRGADIVMACIHWGEEYQQLPNRSQQRLADWLCRQGVELIIGSHPHVVQPLELRTDPESGRRSLVVYSLGNFVSNMSRPHSDGGILVTAKVRKSEGRAEVVSAGYLLHYTRRPNHGAGPGYEVLPAARTLERGDSLPASLREPLSRFVKETRSLLERHGQGVNEVK